MNLALGYGEYDGTPSSERIQKFLYFSMGRASLPLEALASEHSRVHK